ncbi:hypothetical protein PMAYCL1PPCAC_24809 [Pristionchus mayeri]|uniref:Uncharacterized protein n=1 Tax=Pristionchus mayeri TaxID=1317129 RepID=A0AAN5D1E7_9BILA|nr:hypothetical protein PMAYCL1PPCAC_24806 [Pristionchus mayeri]GMR54614.1 hypothetical protein PMAYCL1PPCAC_24809 [Pristionchus mayeri]
MTVNSESTSMLHGVDCDAPWRGGEDRPRPTENVRFPWHSPDDYFRRVSRSMTLCKRIVHFESNDAIKKFSIEKIPLGSCQTISRAQTITTEHSNHPVWRR